MYFSIRTGKFVTEVGQIGSKGFGFLRGLQPDCGIFQDIQCGFNLFRAKAARELNEWKLF